MFSCYYRRMGGWGLCDVNLSYGGSTFVVGLQCQMGLVSKWTFKSLLSFFPIVIISADMQLDQL